MKTYLFTYSQMCPVWQAQAILNTTGAVTTWVQPFPQAAIIVSTLNAHDLAAVFRSRLGETWFLITELNSAAVNGICRATSGSSYKTHQMHRFHFSRLLPLSQLGQDNQAPIRNPLGAKANDRAIRPRHRQEQRQRHCRRRLQSAKSAEEQE